MVRRQCAARHRWTGRHLWFAHRVHAGEQGLRAQRSFLNGTTTAALDGHFDVAELGAALRVQRRFSWSAAQHRYRLDKSNADYDVCLVALGHGLSRSEHTPISVLRSTRPLDGSRSPPTGHRLQRSPPNTPLCPSAWTERQRGSRPQATIVQTLCRPLPRERTPAAAGPVTVVEAQVRRAIRGATLEDRWNTAQSFGKLR